MLHHHYYDRKYKGRFAVHVTSKAVIKIFGHRMVLYTSILTLDYDNLSLKSVLSFFRPCVASAPHHFPLYVRECKERLVLMWIQQRSLHFRTYWYLFLYPPDVLNHPLINRIAHFSVSYFDSSIFVRIPESRQESGMPVSVSWSYLRDTNKFKSEKSKRARILRTSTGIRRHQQSISSASHHLLYSSKWLTRTSKSTAVCGRCLNYVCKERREERQKDKRALIPKAVTNIGWLNLIVAEGYRGWWG